MGDPDVVGGVGLACGECGDRLLQRGRVLDVEHDLRAVDLAHQAGEDLAGADLDKGRSPLLDQELDTLDPAYGRGDRSSPP